MSTMLSKLATTLSNANSSLTLLCADLQQKDLALHELLIPEKSESSVYSALRSLMLPEKTNHDIEMVQEDSQSGIEQFCSRINDNL